MDNGLSEPPPIVRLPPPSQVLASSPGSHHTLRTIGDRGASDSKPFYNSTPDKSPQLNPIERSKIAHPDPVSTRTSRSNSVQSSSSYPGFNGNYYADGNVYSPPRLSRSRASSASSVSSAGSASSNSNRSGSWLSQIAKSRGLLIATIKAVALFLICLAAVIIAVRNLLPPIEPEDAPFVKIPRSFDDLKQLNRVLQIYKTLHFNRVLATYVVIYLFLQAFSLPGSMYLSMLAGAMYGVFNSLMLCCLCIATGASLCYGISALIGPDVLAISQHWRNRVDSWGDRVKRQGGNVISYLIVLRIAPLIPHWLINIVAPHLAISFGTFYLSTFIGVLGATFIHVQIGTTLDQMSSPKDFHLISWRNFFGLAGVVFAALIPVFLRMRWQNELEDAAEGGGAIRLPGDTSILPRSRSSTVSSMNGAPEPGINRSRSGSKTFIKIDDDDTSSLISLAPSQASKSDVCIRFS